MVQLLWKAVWQFCFTKLNILLLYDPEVTLLGIYPNELKKICPHKKLLHTMFIAALFIIPKIWKQPRCPSVSEWINCDTSRQWNIIQP